MSKGNPIFKSHATRIEFQRIVPNLEGKPEAEIFVSNTTAKRIRGQFRHYSHSTVLAMDARAEREGRVHLRPVFAQALAAFPEPDSVG